MHTHIGKAVGWLALAGVTLAGAAQPAAPDPRPIVLFEAGADAMISGGISEWEILFENTALTEGRSILSWEELDAETYGFHARVGLGRWFSVAGAYAEGDIEGGRNTDTDTYSDFIYGLDTFTFSESEADTDGDVEFYHADLRFHIHPWQVLRSWPGELYLLVGYSRYEENLLDQNGVQTIVNEERVNIPIDGLASTFDFEWEALRVGAGGTLQIVPRVRLKAEAALLVNVKYRGEGFWNLRDDFKPTPPNFIQSGKDGTGLEAQAAVAWKPWEHVEFELGVQGLWYGVEDGVDRLTFADGEVVESELDYAHTGRVGFYLGATVLF